MANTYDAITKAMTGSQRDAFTVLADRLSQYGLGTLAAKVADFIKKGFSGEAISALLPETPEYKQRFAANDARIKAGLPVLPPAQYIATEAAYQQVLRASGIPKGFYDSPSDFTKWIAGDVSPSEVQQRVDKAVQFTNQTDPSTRQALSSLYGVDDKHLVAWALDPTRALPIMQKQARAAEAAGAAIQQGLTLNRGQAEGVADYTQGMSQGQVQNNFGQVAELTGRGATLASIQGEAPYTVGDAIKDVFAQNAQAQQKRRGLASQERAEFSGGNSIGKASLGVDTQV